MHSGRTSNSSWVPPTWRTFGESWYSSTTSIAEGLPPAGASEGKNGYGKTGWGSPCPPSGEHHYIFVLYALDAPQIAGADEIPKHAVAQAKLIGRYARK